MVQDEPASLIEVKDGMIVLRELQASDPQFIGPYRLRGLLGVGGMGRVFLGVSPAGQPKPPLNQMAHCRVAT